MLDNPHGDNLVVCTSDCMAYKEAKHQLKRKKAKVKVNVVPTSSSVAAQFPASRFTVIRGDRHKWESQKLTGEIIVVRLRRYPIYKWRQNGRGKSSQSKLSEKASIKTQLCVTSDYCLLSSSDHLQAKSFTTPNQIVPRVWLCFGELCRRDLLNISLPA
jgi:hypothetical protein